MNKTGVAKTSPPLVAPESNWGWSSAAVGGTFYDTANVDPARRSHAFPAYYHGKLFIAEFVHRWIRVVTLDDTAGFDGVERFVGEHALSRILDLTFSKDGRLLVLEWGSAYQPNDGNAKITRISYLGGDFSCGESPTTAARPRPKGLERAGGPVLRRMEAGMSLPVPPGTTGIALWSLEGRSLLRRDWNPAAAPARIAFPPGLDRNGMVWTEFLRRRR